MDATAKLTAIAEIKQLKAKYFLGVDTQDFDLIRDQVFIPDVSFTLPEFRPEPYRGADKVLGMFGEGLGGMHSVHHGHMPIIEITSETTATGIWAMEDRIYWGKPSDAKKGALYLHGFGHYHETYVKTDAGWRIETVRLTRLRRETANIF
jgi:hypothetical protein